MVSELDVSGSYADSDDMLVRLEADTAYQRYRSQLPGSNPAFLSLSQLLNTDSVDLPNGFPIGQGTWTVVFQGGGDSSMTCFVASETGEAFCRRIYGLPTSAVVEDVSRGATGTSGPKLTVQPNPASGQVVITIAGKEPNALAQSTLLLYNQAGELVLDLTESFRENQFTQATFPALLLPPGLYHCTLVGPSVQEHVGVIVVE